MTVPHFAQLDENNKVVRFAVVEEEYLRANPDRYPGTWVNAHRDTEGKTPAFYNSTYDPDTDTFAPPPPPEPVALPE